MSVCTKTGGDVKENANVAVELLKQLRLASELPLHSWFAGLTFTYDYQIISDIIKVR